MELNPSELQLTAFGETVEPNAIATIMRYCSKDFFQEPRDGYLHIEEQFFWAMHNMNFSSYLLNGDDETAISHYSVDVVKKIQTILFTDRENLDQLPKSIQSLVIAYYIALNTIDRPRVHIKYENFLKMSNQIETLAENFKITDVEACKLDSTNPSLSVA